MNDTIVAVENFRLVLSCPKCSNLLNKSGDLCSQCGHVAYVVEKKFAVAVPVFREDAPSLEEVKNFITSRAAQKEADKKKEAEDREKMIAQEKKRSRLFLFGTIGAALFVILLAIVSKIVSTLI